MGLHGGGPQRGYVTSQADPTADKTPGGRWVATDESGWNGEQLLGPTSDRFLVIGSVAVDDHRAFEIVDWLRSEAGVRQAPELKFQHFRRHPHRLDVLAAALDDRELLAGRVSLYFIDKPFMVAGKIIDLLIEEHAHAQGRQLPPELLRAMARTLANEGPAALGEARYAGLLQSIVVFASANNVAGSQMKTAEFMRTIREARDSCARGPVREILNRAGQAGYEAADLLTTGAPSVKYLEPLIPGLTVVAEWWIDRLAGPVRLLADEQIELTDGVLQVTAAAAGAGHPAEPGTAVITRGRSIDHPSIQLADLMAGAALAVSRVEQGIGSSVPLKLQSIIMRHMNPRSLLPHDETDRLLL